MENTNLENKEVQSYGGISLDNNILFNGECLEVMDYLISKNVVVDAIITDPPYGWILEQRLAVGIQ